MWNKRQIAQTHSQLPGRKQKVSVTVTYETFVSNDIEVLSGVPQRSLLGPLLIIIYI